MRLMQIKLEVRNNVISFQNQYLKECFIGKGNIDGKKRNKYNVKVMSQCHPQIDVGRDDGNNLAINIYLQGTDSGPEFIYDGPKVSAEEIDIVIGKILVSLALFDLKNSIPEIDGEERVSELIFNGIKYELDTSKQLEIARFLLGNEL